MYTCICVSVYACMSACVHAYVCVFVCVCVYVRAHLFVSMSVHGSKSCPNCVSETF